MWWGVGGCPWHGHQASSSLEPEALIYNSGPWGRVAAAGSPRGGVAAGTGMQVTAGWKLSGPCLGGPYRTLGLLGTSIQEARVRPLCPGL